MNEVDLKTIIPAGHVVSLILAAAVAGATVTTETSASPPAITIHVAPGGQTLWSGRLCEPSDDNTDGPLPSIIAARDMIRRNRAAGVWQNLPINVLIQPGIYHLEQPLTFAPEDSGLPDAPVLYSGQDKTHTIISGGRLITGWKPVNINGMTAWSTQLSDISQDPCSFQQFFVNGQRRPRPRLPAEGCYRFAGYPGFTPNAKYRPGQSQAHFENGHIRKWKNLSDVELVILHYWVSPRMQIADVNEDQNLVTFTQPTLRKLTDSFNTKQFARYYLDNVFEALDHPGEWYLDRPTSTLYYIPIPGETPENTRCYAPYLKQLVSIGTPGKDNEPTHHITLSNLSFQHAEWIDPNANCSDKQASSSLDGAITMHNSHNCSLINCAVRSVSGYAVAVNTGCRGIAIDRNQFSDLGAGGVKIWHDSEQTRITNTEISNGGQVFHNAVGILLGQSNDNVVAHNHIHHLYYSAISVGWVWGYAPSKAARNVIEYNHLHDIGQGLLSDMAGVYTLGVSPGTVIRNNLIHDITADNYGGWGLYTDEGSSRIVMENNVVYRTTHGGFHQHYGRDNIIRNNIFAHSRNAQVMRTREEKHNSFTFDHNIVYFSSPTLLGGHWKNDNYVMDDNLYYRIGDGAFHFAGASLDDWRRRKHDTRSVIADPLFADPQNDDFTLKPESPAWQLGFKPIDLTTVGPCRDE